MLRIADNVNFEELKKHGFKYGARDKFIYKTKQNGCEASIYVDMLPCYNNNDALKIECKSFSIPNKINDKLYDLIQAGLVEKV